MSLPESPRSRSLDWRLPVLALLFVGTIVFLLGEVFVRVLARTDADGNTWVRRWQLRPHQLPVESVRQRVADYRKRAAEAYLIDDPQTGWRVGPRRRSANGLYQSNAQGLRSAGVDADTPLQPTAGRTRVALFGASFTHGDEVPFEATIGSQLERRLGPNAEVLNFAVSGFGMDQVFLHWRERGRAFAPDVVVWGLYPPNDARRNMNLVRPIYFAADPIVFSKPRFVLEGDDLLLVNAPCVPPEEVPALLAEFEAWPLHVHEAFYDPAAHARHPWLASRLVATLAARLLDRPRLRAHELPDAAIPLARAIATAFAQEVEDAGAEFLVVNLPARRDLQQSLAGTRLAYADLLAAIRQRHRLLDATEVLAPEAAARGLETLFVESGLHYTQRANGVVAAAIADALAPQSTH
ncbi:MAG: hypothetical protein MJE66_02670 [Proteobacteria bacterium]|nr:hypothetical protein [Pseudomonadota bacterium]